MERRGRGERENRKVNYEKNNRHRILEGKQTLLKKFIDGCLENPAPDFPCKCGSLQLVASMEELGVEVLAARLASATAERDAAAAEMDRATASVEAATRELAGVEAGDGRDESNRSMQERLADAQTAQVPVVLQWNVVPPVTVSYDTGLRVSARGDDT